MRANRHVPSKLLIKQYLASSVVADQGPAIFHVKPFGAGTRSGAEIGDRIAGISQCLTGHRKKRLPIPRPSYSGATNSAQIQPSRTSPAAKACTAPASSQTRFLTAR